MTLPIKTTEPPGIHLLTEHDLALRWWVSRRTLQRLRREGRLPEPFRIGRKVLYRLDAIIAFEGASSKSDEA